MVALADDAGWSEMGRVHILTRAAEIAAELRDEGAQQTVARRIVTRIESELDSSNERPGISLRLLESLLRIPESRRPSDVGPLLDRAQEVYGSDPWQLDTIVDLKARLLSDEEQVELRQAQVAAWREKADETVGIVRAHHLERALEVANAFGLSD